MTLDDVRQHALALPDAVESPHFDFASFRVRGRIFLSAPPAGGCLHCFVDDTTREQALTLHPGFVETLYWGRKVAGIRVRLAEAEPAVVRALVRKAWECKAPKALREATPA